MKTMRRIVISLMMCSAIIGCNKDKEEEVGYAEMQVRMTDAPALYAEVNVEVEKVQISYSMNGTASDSTDSTSNSNAGWIDLETEAGIYNLLELQNGVTTVISSDQQLKTGMVTQMRLVLGANNSVKLQDGTMVTLEMSSQAQTGVKLNLDTRLSANATTEVLIDFDAEKSIVVQGDGSLQLKPVITVVSVEQN